MDSVSDYPKALSAALARGNSTEHTHRPALKVLIESLAKGVTATNEPKRIACGSPDFIITKGELPIGYIEAKDNLALFRQLCGLGGPLVGLHLMEQEGTALARFTMKGSDEVEKLRYEPRVEGGRVWINGSQYFAGVPEEVWAFHVGGYQVCEKWLKDRKGRMLDSDDLNHYRRVVAALGDTIRLMGEIDKAIEASGGWPLK